MFSCPWCGGSFSALAMAFEMMPVLSPLETVSHLMSCPHANPHVASACPLTCARFGGPPGPAVSRVVEGSQWVFTAPRPAESSSARPRNVMNTGCETPRRRWDSRIFAITFRRLSTNCKRTISSSRLVGDVTPAWCRIPSSRNLPLLVISILERIVSVYRGCG